jgi:hypothetical protein
MNTIRKIYHCCVQKTASQWFKAIFSDRLFTKATSFTPFDPEKNFIGTDAKELKTNDTFPPNSIITPLYLSYENFKEIKKPDDYKAFFVMRDPRDILISYYFSVRFSHADNPYVREERKLLESMNQEDGILSYIKRINETHHAMYYCMKTWFLEGNSNDRVMNCRYEDLFSDKQQEIFETLFAHLELPLDPAKIEKLLKKYSFKRLTGGREKGEENKEKHLRKGISGDWKNHFTEQHKQAFKETAGQLLIDLEYEKDNNW